MDVLWQRKCDVLHAVAWTNPALWLGRIEVFPRGPGETRLDFRVFRVPILAVWVGHGGKP